VTLIPLKKQGNESGRNHAEIGHILQQFVDLTTIIEPKK